MPSADAATVCEICRYPVKGLNAEVLDDVALVPGQPLPDDRRFAVAYGLGTGAKRGFFELLEEERLAQLRVAYDPAVPTVTPVARCSTTATRSDTPSRRSASTRRCSTAKP